MTSVSCKVVSSLALLLLAGCTPAIGTHVSVADARAFSERVATREQVRARFGMPDLTQASTGGVCEHYLWTGQVNPFGGPYESSKAMFCYNDQNLLVLKNVTETASK